MWSPSLKGIATAEIADALRQKPFDRNERRRDLRWHTVEYTRMNTSISVVLPTYTRERLLVNTIAALLQLLKEGDEILVIDQSLAHEAETDTALTNWAERQAVASIVNDRARRGIMSKAARDCSTSSFLALLILGRLSVASPTSFE
jgi:hypothetical protein